MEEMELNIGAEVRCKDGDCGKLIKVVIDPQAKKISEIIVEKGLLLNKDRVIPVEKITQTSEEQVHIDVKSDELDQFREYEEEDFVTPEPEQYTWEESTTYEDGELVAPATPYQPRPIFQDPARSTIHFHAHEGTSPTEEVIEPGTRVFNPEGTVGKVDQIKVDPESRQITHIIVDRGLLSGNILVPVEEVKSVSEDGVYITLNKEDIEEMEHHTEE